MIKSSKKIFKKILVIIMISLIILSSIAPSIYAVSGEDILNKAREKAGTKYVLGQPSLERMKDTSCSQFDCSGLVGWTLTQLGMDVKTRSTSSWQNKNNIFRDSKIKIEEIDINDKSKWQIGDLLLFDGHVSIYAGMKNGKHRQFHASSPSIPVGETPYWATSPLRHVYRVGDGSSSSANAATTRKVIEDVKIDIEKKNKFFYNGIPKGQVSVEKKENPIRRLVLFLKDILYFLVMLFINMFKLPFIGAATLMEIMTTNTFEAITGNPNYIKNDVNTEFYIDHRRAVTVENILLNRIEFLNVDFFISPSEALKRSEGKTGTGVDIKKIDEKAKRGGNSDIAVSYSPLSDEIARDKYNEENRNQNGNNSEKSKPTFEELPVGLLRKTVSKTYYITLATAISIMFIAAVLSSILGMVQTVAGKKEAYKTYALEWIKATFYTIGTIILVVAIIKLNSSFVSSLYNILIKGQSETYSLYETVRTRAYSLQPLVGYSSTIMYVILAWFTIKFALMYAKRVLLVMIMLVVAPFLPVYSLIRKLVTGQSEVYIMWVKEFIYTVLIQSIHVFIYFLFVTIAMKTGEESIFGIIIMVIVLKVMMDFTSDVRKYLHTNSGSHSILGNVLDSSTPLSLAQGYLGASYLKARKKSLDKFVKKGSSKLPSIAEKTVAATYNNFQRVKETLIGTPEEREISRENRRAQEGPQNLNDNSQNDSQLARALNKNANNNNQNELKTFQEQIALAPEAAKKSFMQKLADRNTFKQTNYIVIDEQGRKRMLPPELRYDNKTGKLKENSTIRKNLKKDMTALMGMNPKDFNNMMKLTFSSLKASVGVLGTIMFLPVYLTDPGFAALATNMSWTFMNKGKNNKETLKENAKKAKEQSKIEVKLLPYKTIPVLLTMNPIRKRYRRYKRDKNIKENINALSRGQKVQKYSFKGLTSDYLYDFSMQTNAAILEVMAKKQNQRVDVGKIRYKKLKLEKNHSLGGSFYEKNHKRIKDANKLALANAEIFYAAKEEEAIGMFGREELGNKNIKFLEAAKTMKIQEMEQEVNKLVDNEKNYLELSRSIEGYKIAKENYNTLANGTNNLNDVLEAQVELDKIKEETLTNLSDKIICNLKSETLKTITPIKVENQLDMIFRENGLEDLSDVDKQETYNRIMDKVIREYKVEEKQRINSRARNTNYTYENSSKKTKKYIENLKKQEVNDLTIGEIRDLKKERIKSYSEGMKVINNVRAEARARVEAGNTKQIRDINKYYKGKDLTFMFGTNVHSEDLEKFRTRNIQQLAKKYNKKKKKKEKKETEEKVNPWDIKEDEEKKDEE